MEKADEQKKVQLELLMEKLRIKTSHHGTFIEMAKLFRSTLEKRFPGDVNEKKQYQKCLDLIQTNMKVVSLQGMLERLESISRQLGLKFTAGHSGTDFFISSDMFYLEVIVETTGVVREVQIQHEGKNESQVCAEIAQCLNKGDFTEFSSHLQGLCAIYQVNADKKIKSKAFNALSSLEADLTSLSQLQALSHDPEALVFDSAVGVLQNRLGGQPLRLTYFVAPYTLLDTEKGTCLPFTVENILERKLGYSCTVGIEGSNNQQLQIVPLLTIPRGGDSQSMPSFAQLSMNNSLTLPATFVLRLNAPLPLCRVLAQQIQAVTGIEFGDWSQSESILKLLLKQGEMDTKKDPLGRQSRPLFVTLPDQQHCYFFSDSGESGFEAVHVSLIPFSHPSHVPRILNCLRQQAVLNTVLSSCIRPKSQSDLLSSLTFEVNMVSHSRLSVAFEHPALEYLCTADIDLSRVSSVQCRLYCCERDGLASDEYATKVLQRCLSIPVTMRAILRQTQSFSRWNNADGGCAVSMDTHVLTTLAPDADGRNGPGTHSSTPTFGGGGSLHNNQSPRMMKESGKVQSNNDEVIITDETKASGSEAAAQSQINRPARSVSEEPGPKHSGIPVSQTKFKPSLMRIKSDSWAPLNSSSEMPILGLNTSESGVSLSFFTPPPSSGRRGSDSVSIKQESGQDSDSSDSVSVNHLSKLKETKIYPSVSITPVTIQSGSQSSSYSSVSSDRRPGIEIIPLGGASPGIPSSLSITPIGVKPKEKDKYKDIRVKESRVFDVEDRDRDKEKERERKDRKRRREEEKAFLMGGAKPPKMACTTPTLMGPPTLMKPELSPKMSFKNSPTTPPLGPVPSPSLSPVAKHGSSKSSTPSSSPKHPSSGGKPSMSALKSAASPSSKSKKSKDREKDRDRSRERSRDKDSEDGRDRERSREREKKLRTPTPTSMNSSSSGSARESTQLVRTKSLELQTILEDKNNDIDSEDPEILAITNVSGSSKERNFSESPGMNENDSGRPSENPESHSSSSSYSDNSATGTVQGLGNSKSPVRSRKSSLSAVIDKLRLQHNSDGEFLGSGSKLSSNPPGKDDSGKGAVDPRGRQTEPSEFIELSPKLESDSKDFKDVILRENNADSESDLDRDVSDGNGEKFVRPFPLNHAAYAAMRSYRAGDCDTAPSSPSVSVHIVNMPSPLSLQPTRSPISNPLANALISASGASPQSNPSRASPCIIDDDLMDEALVGLGK